MAMSINTNVASLNSQRALSASQGSLQTAMQRLSSGLRLNSAKDDAAGVGIAERFTAQVRGNTVAIRNANDAISMAQTADGALSKVADMFQRMRELAVQGANGTNDADSWKNLTAEYKELGKEVDRVLKSTKFNGVALLNSSADVTFQVGANNVGDDQVTLATADVNMAGHANVTAITTAAVGNTLLDWTGITDAQTAMNTVDSALTTISEARAKLGAYQVRFENTVANLQSTVENVSAARGRIVDADFASETANLSRSQVLQQAGTAMLAQANQSAQNVMQLLR